MTSTLHAIGPFLIRPLGVFALPFFVIFLALALFVLGEQSAISIRFVRKQDAPQPDTPAEREPQQVPLAFSDRAAIGGEWRGTRRLM
jgi:hypothetical protein